MIPKRTRSCPIRRATISGSGRAATAVLLAGWLLSAGPVLAHAGLVRADPPDLCGTVTLPRLAPEDPHCTTGVILSSAPSSVQLFFSEPVQPIGAGISVVSPSGGRAERGLVGVNGAELKVALEASESGTYHVRWQAISNDTHALRGGYAFSVGQSSVGPGGARTGAAEFGGVSTVGLALQAAARWLHFLGFALGFGTLAFAALVLRPAGTPAGNWGKQQWVLVNAGIILLLVAEPLGLAAQSASLDPTRILDGGTLSELLASNLGRVGAQRAGAALLLWVLAGVVRQSATKNLGPALALGLGLAVVDGQASHAMGTTWAWLGLGVNAIHIAAMGVWVGGLSFLVVLWGGAARETRMHWVKGFGRIAGLSLVALAITGGVMAWQHLSGPSDLVSNSYGITLTVKVLAVLAALMLALPARQAMRARAEGPAYTREARRWWTVELGSLLLILVLVGVLVSLPPPR